MLGGEPKELSIERSLPHGHVAAVLGMIRKIALDRLILSRSKNAEAGRYCDLIVAMMVDRLIAPRSKLGFVRAVDQETATTSLGDVLGLGHVRERKPMRRWIGSLPGRRVSRTAWPSGISRMAWWCFMT